MNHDPHLSPWTSSKVIREIPAIPHGDSSKKKLAIMKIHVTNDFEIIAGYLNEKCTSERRVIEKKATGHNLLWGSDVFFGSFECETVWEEMQKKKDPILDSAYAIDSQSNKEVKDAIHWHDEQWRKAERTMRRCCSSKRRPPKRRRRD